MGDAIQFPTRWPDELQQHEDSFVSDDPKPKYPPRKAPSLGDIEAMMVWPGYWKGAAGTREYLGSSSTLCKAIEAELRAGRTLDRIPEYRLWRGLPRV